MQFSVTRLLAPNVLYICVSRFTWEYRKMGSFLDDLWCRAAEAPSQTWDWFNSLNREEWLVVLVVVCVSGFVSLLGFQSRRL